MFVLPALLSVAPALAADTYDLDPVHTSVLFSVHHFNAAWVYGRFDKVSGSFTVDGGAPTAVSLTIDAASVDTNNKKRDDHLRSPDFFDAAKYPEITFSSTAVKPAGEGRYEVTGDLTLHGVTKPITFTVTYTGEGADPWGGYRMGYEAAFTVKRSEFGMSGMLQGLSDDVRVIVAVEGIRK